jgi:hypothetical protein
MGLTVSERYKAQLQQQFFKRRDLEEVNKMLEQMMTCEKNVFVF